MIDLDKAERVAGPVLRESGAELFARSSAAVPGRCGRASINVPYASLHGTVVRRVELIGVTTRLDVFYQIGKPRTLPREVQILDGGLHDGFDFRIKHPAPVRPSAMLGNQCRSLRPLPVCREEPIKIRTVNAERGCRIVHLVTPDSTAGSEWPEDRLACTGNLP